MPTRFRATGLLVLLLLGPAGTLSAQTIDTRLAFRGEVLGGDGIYGQSFTVDASYPVLNDFSLFVGSYGAPSTQFKAYLYAFDGERLTGPALFTSAVQTGIASWEPLPAFTFATPGLSLTPGGVYMALIQNTVPGYLGVGFAQPTESTFADSYPGGQFYAGTYSGDPQASSYDPMSFVPGNDLEFVAHFSAAAVTATPEPASILLLATGLAGVFGAARRRRGVSSAC